MLNAVGTAHNAMDFRGACRRSGRGFGEQDMQTGTPPAGLLNDRFGKRESQRDRSVIGRTIMAILETAITF